MSFRIIFCLLAILVNLMAYRAMRRAVKVFLDPGHQDTVLKVISALILLLNLPLLLLFDRQAGGFLYSISPEILKVVFLPTSVWMSTLIIFTMLAVPIFMVAAMVKNMARLINRTTKPDVSDSSSQAGPPVSSRGWSRRDFLAGSGGLLLPGILAMTSYKAYGSTDGIDIPPERSIRMPHLPGSLEGLRVVQISDIHVGPFMGEAALRHVVHLIDGLHPDLVFITGDMIDRSLSDLPTALRGLNGIRSTLGTYAVLGNHDISSDAFSRSGGRIGGVQIVKGFDRIGIQTLRNEAIYVGSGGDRLALLGLDWLSQPGDPRFYSYRQAETRTQLNRLMKQIDAETPTILLAHHPDSFDAAAEVGIGLTLAGHSHGGQIVLADIGHIPVTLASLRLRYVSGFYQEKGSSLYVNRGIGYFGIPVRINCRPEISLFKLMRGRNE